MTVCLIDRVLFIVLVLVVRSISRYFASARKTHFPRDYLFFTFSLLQLRGSTSWPLHHFSSCASYLAVTKTQLRPSSKPSDPKFVISLYNLFHFGKDNIKVALEFIDHCTDQCCYCNQVLSASYLKCRSSAAHDSLHFMALQ